MIKTTLKTLKDAFTWQSHLKSIAFGLLASLIILTPWFTILINLLLMYVQYVYQILFITALSLFAFFMLATLLYVKTLKTYNDSAKLATKTCLGVIGLPIASLVFIIALILIITLTPHYL